MVTTGRGDRHGGPVVMLSLLRFKDGGLTVARMAAAS
jgi:hypothetical protein